MIKWRGSDGKREVVGFILLKENIDRLRDGQPIHIYREEMQLPFDIIIGYSETREQFEVAARKAGMITERTVIHNQEKKKRN